MPTKKPNNAGIDSWQEISEYLQVKLPHLTAWHKRPDEFGALNFKARDDGSVLGIAKGYSADGTAVVCFGVGYDVVLSMMALDATIQGGHWRVDKPWKKSS